MKANRARTVTARAPHHVWNIDFTVMPSMAGWWMPWLPQAPAQRWPFAWWIGVVLDHFSRTVIFMDVFRKELTGAELSMMLDQALDFTGRAPKYTVSDPGAQFREEYPWCENNNGVKPRFGAVGKYVSIAVVERFIRTLKEEGLHRILVPLREADMRREFDAFACWYHDARPHQGLGGATPVRDARWAKACLRTAERRATSAISCPRASKARKKRCTRSPALVVQGVEGRAHLPIVALRRAA